MKKALTVRELMDYFNTFDENEKDLSVYIATHNVSRPVLLVDPPCIFECDDGITFMALNGTGKTWNPIP